MPPFDLAPSAKIFSNGDTQMSKHEKSSSRCYKSTMNRHALKSLKVVQEKLNLKTLKHSKDNGKITTKLDKIRGIAIWTTELRVI
jgi:hypothetical protein